MRKYLLLLLAAVLALGMLLTACEPEDEDNITNPEDSEWSLFFVRTDDAAKPFSHFVTAMYIGEPADYEEPTSMTVKIDDVEVDLEAVYTYWYAEVNLNAGDTYAIELLIDDVSKVSTNLTIVNEANATFPASYNPAATAAVTWTLAADNQSQYVSAVSFDNSDYEDDIFEDDVATSTRAYTFAADVVEDFGNMTTYTLEVNQMNFKYVDYVMVVSAQADYQDYGYGFKSRNTPKDIANYCMRLYNRIK